MGDIQVKGSPIMTLSFTPVDSKNVQMEKTNHTATEIVYSSENEKDLKLLSNIGDLYNFIFKNKGIKTCVDQDHFQFAFGIGTFDSTIFQKFTIEKTTKEWLDITGKIKLPSKYSDKYMRAVICSILRQYEPTGAIMAAMTTSIPDNRNMSGRWDYRFNWLRDSMHLILCFEKSKMLNLLIGYKDFLKKIMKMTFFDGLDLTKDQALFSLYNIDLNQSKTIERVDKYLAGFNGKGSVLFGNGATGQRQNDVYGSFVLSALAFIRQNLMSQEEINEMAPFLEKCGIASYQIYLTPDAGIWESRDPSQKVNTYSSVLCYACVDNLAKTDLGKYQRMYPIQYWIDVAKKMREQILDRAWHPTNQCYMKTLKMDGDNDEDREYDASVLVMPLFDIIRFDNDRWKLTIKNIRDTLVKSGQCMRFQSDNKQENIFAICSFWFIQNCIKMGEMDEANKMMDALMNSTSIAGVLSEDLEYKTLKLLGNYPQVYSMVKINFIL